jgi:GNAT superfamily N-acetyltransferase
VGEVAEVYVMPEHRGRGFGRELLSTLTQMLREKGAVVLRALVPMRNEDSLGRFLSLGYRPLHYVLQKGLEDD